MNKGTTSLIIIILILASISGVLYVKYELPRRRNMQKGFANVSISAMYGGKYIDSTLVIQNGDTKEITTRNGYEFLRLKKGIYEIYNKNTSQNFYRSILEYNISLDVQRIDFELSKPKEVTIKSSNNRSLIEIEVDSENFQNAKLCLQHSTNYIFLNLESKEEIDLLDGYEDWDKCYSLEKSIISKEKLNISYEIFVIPTEEDFIKIAIIDTDFINGEYRNRLDGTDLGGEDEIKKVA